ncbi:MAG TPA: hypothetical protein VMS93_03360 [Candidatus Saccharimonadales bacterium]|nr:hypothetical protein [Candidatus Saccharimonadales bacterium]
MAKGKKKPRTEAPAAGREAAGPPESRPARPLDAPPDTSPAWLLWALRGVLAATAVALAVWYVRSSLAAEGRLGFPLDDSYIHFQFARNLAHGHGLSFNPGEPSPGVTSPLWVLLLAAAQLLGAPVEWASVALGVLAAAAAAVFTLEAGRAARLPLGLAFAAGLAVAGAGRITWASVSGMEPCLATALSVALVWLYLSQVSGTRRYLGLGLLAGLCAEARPELLLLGLLVAALEAWRAGRERGLSGAVRAALAMGVPLVALILPYTLFCLATSGRPLPNTYYVKSYLLVRTGGANLAQLRRAYVGAAIRFIAWDNLVAAVLLVPGMVLWVIRRGWARRVAVLLWPLVFWGYSVVRSPLHYNVSRYTIPLIPILALMSTAPLAALAERLRSAVSRRAVELAGVLLLALGAARAQPDGNLLYRMNVDNILKMQVAMGEWVATHLPPGARVMLNDVGAITYFGGCYCIDAMGLISTDLVDYLLENQASLNTALPYRGPSSHRDYVIIFPSWAPAVTRDPNLQKIYEIDYPNNTGGGNELVVYKVLK